MPWNTEEKRKKGYRAWYEKHRKEKIASVTKRQQEHKEEIKEYMFKYRKPYYNINKEKMNEQMRQHYSKNPDYYRKKDDIRHRELDFVPLTKRFEGSHAHHLDNKNIIHIPKSVHKRHWHSLKNPESMKKINFIAWDFMESSIL